MIRKGKGLGKGLHALLGDTPSANTGIVEISISKIQPNPHQPRQVFNSEALQELAKSIQEYGIIQPLIICRQADDYILVAGERRLRAAEIAGLKQVPVIIREYDDPSQAAIALIENLQREDLNPMEEAAAYYRLGDEFKLTQAQVAQQVGRSRSYITNMLRLLQLPDYIREKLKLRELTIGQVRPLISMDDPDEQVRWAQRIEEEGLTARQVEQLLAKPERRKSVSRKKTKKVDSQLEAYVEDLAEKMKVELGTPVQIQLHAGRKAGGVMHITFANVDELSRLAEYFVKE